MTTLTFPSKTSFLTRKIAPGITPARILLFGIMLLSLGLHLINLQAIGDANTYYTAAVKSMLQSWHNFFFAAAEPGGSVTVDKPPLGLWIETAFAFVLGVEGWVVSLPNILSGVLSVPLLYWLVKTHLGALAGLVAALVLTVTPVLIATDRNNTMDGMLVFTLLLAAWAFVKATESGKARWLLLGAFLVGLGFNIKMLQAFLPLPAFYALYFLGAKSGWLRKIFNLSVATVILVIVSLSWAVIVDLTPADQRPYIGSSENNTVMELIVGHNAMSRLFSPRAGNPPPAAPYQAPPGPNPGQQNVQPFRPPPQEALAACAGQSQGAACAFTLPNGTAISGACILPPGMSQLACAPQRMAAQAGQPSAGAPAGIQPPPGAMGDGPNASPNGPNPGGTPFSQETGAPGILRFFQPPLSKQMSWLLPFALFSLVVLIFAGRPRLPLEAGGHHALVLWGGWLLTCLVFFSAVEGIFHAYYVIMLAPALGAVVGGGFALLWRWQAGRPWVSALLVLAAAATVAFQGYTLLLYGAPVLWAWLAGILLLAGIILCPPAILRGVGYTAILASMLLIPFIWTALTTLGDPNVNLPTAYDGAQSGRPGAPQQTQPFDAAQGGPRQGPVLNEPNPADEALVAYLQANTQDVEYLVAVPNARIGSALVLATGRPVLYMGGFTGSDAVIDANGLAEMVANGELRYVLYGGERRGNGEIAAWLTASCTVVPEFSRGPAAQGPFPPGPGAAGPRPGDQPATLYRCG